MRERGSPDPPPIAGASKSGAPAVVRAAGSLLTVLACAATVLLASARIPRAAQDEPTAAPATSASAPPAAASHAPGPASSVETPAATAEASCSIPDRGQGPYGDWEALSLGKVLRPTSAPAEHFDVLLHFHGAEAIRKVVAPMGFDNLVIVALDAGEGSRKYEQAFYAALPLEKLMQEVAEPMRPARLRHLIVSSWSAGYGAVREILTYEPYSPHAVILLDSVHASYADDGKSVTKEAIAPFLAYAKRAQLAEAPMVLTHSDIRPPGYASTTEVASKLIAELGGRRSFAGLTRHYGVQAKTAYHNEQLWVRGYSGTGKPAHCAHLRMLADILRDDVLPALEQPSATSP